MESKKIKNIMSRLQSNIKEPILSEFLHYLVPNHIRNSSQSIKFTQSSFTEMFQEYPFTCEFPKPLLPPAKLNRDFREKIDPVMQLVLTQEKISDDVKRYTEFYKKHVQTLNKDIVKDLKLKTKTDKVKQSVPKYLAETASILNCDPDPHFKGNYNWYYSGGTLNNIANETQNILLFPYMNELVVLPIELQEDYIYKPKFKKAAKVPFTGDLFETMYSLYNNTGRILLRQKNQFAILNLFNLKKNKLQLLEIHNYSSDIPLVSGDLDPFNLNNYCGAKANKEIFVMDMSKKYPISQELVKTDISCSDNWAHFKYDTYRSSILIYVNRNYLYNYDLRTSINKPVLKINLTNYFEDCENISCYSQSCKNENFSYVGANHNLYLYDNRSSKSAIVKKWTHQFKSSPLYIKTNVAENKEFVIITSQLSGETCIILNDWNENEEIPNTCCFPFSPPSILESLSASQFQGHCLNPTLKYRLSSCNIGSCSVFDFENSEVYLFTQNSLNDIFYQGIAHKIPIDEYSYENNKSLHKFKLWEREIINNYHKNFISPLVYSQKSVAFRTFDNFTNQSLKVKNKTVVTDFPYEPSWKRPISELNSFIDILAPELLVPWDILEDPERLPTSSAPHEKVLSWLQINNEKDARNNVATDPLSIDDSKLISVTNLETPEIDITQPELDIIKDDPVSIEYMFLPKVKSNTKNSKKPNKQFKYTPGF